MNAVSRETLLKGKARQYSWPPCSSSFRSAHFYIENIIYRRYKTEYLKEELNCTDPSLSVSIPCWKIQQVNYFLLLKYRCQVFGRVPPKITLSHHRELSWVFSCYDSPFSFALMYRRCLMKEKTQKDKLEIQRSTENTTTWADTAKLFTVVIDEVYTSTAPWHSA